MQKIAHGVFGWDGAERKTDRYGAILILSQGFGADAVSTAAEFDHEVASALEGKKVKLKAVVVESRTSTHAGDLFLGIKPSRPEVGEEIELGVGQLELGEVYWADGPSILLIPSDGREQFWIDPRKFYRLHDQTVDIFVEETDEAETPAPDIESQADNTDVLNCGDGIQVKNRKIPERVYHEVSQLGDGMFALTPPTRLPVGARVKTRLWDDDDRIWEDDFFKIH